MNTKVTFSVNLFLMIIGMFYAPSTHSTDAHLVRQKKMLRLHIKHLQAEIDEVSKHKAFLQHQRDTLKRELKLLDNV